VAARTEIPELEGGHLSEPALTILEPNTVHASLKAAAGRLNSEH
jgi:hypothetical protein